MIKQSSFSINKRCNRWCKTIGIRIRKLAAKIATCFAFLIPISIFLQQSAITFYKFLTGLPTSAPEVDSSRAKMRSNEYYRDRLQVDEIDALFDVADALELPYDFILKFFRVFADLDILRKSTIAIKQIHLYCGLRRTRLSDILMPVNHRIGFRKVPGRFDIIQFLAAMFSVCTLTPKQIINEVAQRAKDDSIVDLLHQVWYPACEELANEELDFRCNEDASCIGSKELLKQVSRLLTLVYGHLNENEKCLKKLLMELYNPTNDKYKHINFMKIHEIKDLRDLLYLYPVLIYPAFRFQRGLKTRIVGVPFWERLRSKREELLNYGLLKTVVTHNDIIMAVKARKKAMESISIKDPKTLLKSSTRRLSASTRRLSSSAIKVLPGGGQVYRVISQKSFKKILIQSSALDKESIFYKYKTIEDAWKITADTLLTTIYVRDYAFRFKETDIEKLSKIAKDTAEKLVSNRLIKEELSFLHKSIVRDYGYKFTTFVFRLSHAAHFVTLDQEKDMITRLELATRGGQLPSDKNSWKELFDSKEELPFYYNFRTGESKWNRPVDMI